MPLQIVRNDITKMQTDAIVNAANESLLGGGGVDGAIHRAAGPKLLEECRKLHGCRTGEAKITKGYRLQAEYVIHTVGPIWRGGKNGERDLLCSCYRNSLLLAEQYECKSVAFPLISSGIYGYPKAQALQVAVEEISAFLLQHEMTVYIVVFDKKAVEIGEKLFSDIREYIDDLYVDEHRDSRRRMQERWENADRIHYSYDMNAAPLPSFVSEPKESSIDESCLNTPPLGFSLDDMMSMIDESFSQMLLRKIDEAGIKDSECYKRANIDRKLFSKIRNDVHYKPKKTTAIAFAIALGLSFEEAEELLLKAGYALSHSSKFDIIIEYCIKKKIYNIHEVNEILFAFDQPLLG